MECGFPLLTNTEGVGLLELLSCQWVQGKFVVATTEMAVNVDSKLLVNFLCVEIELQGGFQKWPRF